MQNKEEVKQKFADMWRKSREDANKSQAYMAKKLDVSKKTVQNWESGVSCPSQEKGFEWFDALGVPPLPYYLNLLYKGVFDVKPSSDDDRIELALLTAIKTLTPAEKRKIFYLLYGNHGSSPAGVLDLVTAYLHTPLMARLNVAANIISNYELAETYDYTVNPDNIRPDISFLINSYETAKQAVIDHKTSYFTKDSNK